MLYTRIPLLGKRWGAGGEESREHHAVQTVPQKMPRKRIVEGQGGKQRSGNLQLIEDIGSGCRAREERTTGEIGEKPLQTDVLGRYL